MSRKPKPAAPEPAAAPRFVRLQLPHDEYRHVTVAAAAAGLRARGDYVRRLIRQDMERKPVQS